MKISEIELVLAEYIRTQMIPVMPTTPAKFILMAGSTLVLNKLEKLIAQYESYLKTLDIMKENGEIDVDALYSASKEGMKATNGILEVAGFTFNQADIDKLYKMLKEVK